MYKPLYPSNSRLVTPSKENPCPHCGKPDWCYSIGELSVCNRENPPADGWVETTKTDSEGKFYYAPIQEPKEIRPAQTRYWEYPARDGSKLVRVKRVDDGDGKKKITQQHWDGGKWVSGLGDINRERIPVYRYQEVQKAIAENQLIFVVEGEPCADVLRNLGFTATCNIGGSGRWEKTNSMDLCGGKVIICPDRDEPGIKHADQIAQDFPDAQWLYPYPESPAWDNLPKSQGLDIADWISSKKLTAENLINSITLHPRTRKEVVCQKYDSNINDYIPDTAPIPEQNYVQKAVEALYSRTPWASVAGQLFEFTGTHYELRAEATEKRRILDWLSTYSELVKGKYRCNRANPASVNEVYSYELLAVAVDPNTINPDGLNTTKGVVKINPDGSHSLVPHDPKQVYTYVGCTYDPDIDATDCDRLLECLEPSQREIFLRTAAAALNLRLVRSKLTGRGVKGLLCYGEGSNGKDTLRAVLAAVFGRGMTGKSLSDFKSYDNGRKFSLAGVEGSICNWASENTAKVDLDSIQSLKQLITGDPIDIERKGKDSYEYKPAAIFFANCNKLPSITGGTAAIDDRYGILSFKKTYKRDADPSQGELEADPRFKDDENFILERIAPAMLNKMLERLPLLLTEGIDYKATREAMREAQEESRHLWQFVRDLGYESGKGERVYAKDLWSELQEWYQEAGILELEWNEKGKEKLIWNELPNQWDKPVKAINQLYARLCEIFPKLEKHRHTEAQLEGQVMGSFYFLGIRKQNTKSRETASEASESYSAVKTASELLQKRTFSEAVSEAVSEATILTQVASEASEALNPTILELCNGIAKLTLSDKQKLVELLTGVPCSDPLKAFRVGDKVAGNNPDELSYNWHGRIVEIDISIGCKVDWQEREKMKGGRVLSALFCNLRKI